MAVSALRALLRQQIVELTRLTIGEIGPAQTPHAQLKSECADFRTDTHRLFNFAIIMAYVAEMTYFGW